MNQANVEQFNQFKDQFASASRQFADTAGQVSRLALSNAEQVFGVQLAAIEQNVNATFAFWGQLAEARDVDGLKALWPNGVQVARENVERAINAGQDVIGRTLKTNEAIGQIAKGQFERATAQAKDVAAQVSQAANKATEQASEQVKSAGKAAK
jgi:hypothetical protein